MYPLAASNVEAALTTKYAVVFVEWAESLRSHKIFAKVTRDIQVWVTTRTCIHLLDYFANILCCKISIQQSLTITTCFWGPLQSVKSTSLFLQTRPPSNSQILTGSNLKQYILTQIEMIHNNLGPWSCMIYGTDGRPSSLMRERSMTCV